MFQCFLKNCRWLVAFWGCLTVFIALAFSSFLHNDNGQSYSLLQQCYLIFTQYGWFGLICLAFNLVLLPLAILPTHYFKVIITIVFSILLLILNVDLVVFEQYKFHINALLINMFFNAGNEVFDISWVSWLFFIGLYCFYLVGLGFVFWLSKQVLESKLKWILMISWFISLLLSQGIHAYSNALYSMEFSQFNNKWPLYYPLTAREFLYKNNIVNRNKAEKNRIQVHSLQATNILYPLHSVQIDSDIKKPNVLFIMIDAWRFSDATKSVMPNVSQFAQKTYRFQEHRSGGNSTQAGMFSLFYSLPPTYWDSFYASQTSPIFMNKIIESGYQTEILGSATLNSPPLGRTIFKEVKQLRLHTPGKNAVERDAQITQDFLTFLKNKRNDQPYLGFLFYDAAHASDFSADSSKFEPYVQRVDHALLNNNFDASLYHNRYKNSLVYIDKLIAQVLAKVNLKDTVIVITSDHGQEFNDNKQNYWGHSSNYSDVQIHVPLYVYLPEHNGQVINYRTNHYDIMPTLMSEIFHSPTATSDYSVGYNLFDPKPRDWFIAGSYYNYAIVGPDAMLATYPGGGYQSLDNHLKPISGSRIPIDVIKKQVDLMAKYYKH
ncbi:DUF3413 domain-containing protein [Photobacterium damselae]|uniref:DUF3413 domain-containing protein n=1 Tax=Photobacterium damselae TaxID=38293 RepID=UPI00370C38F6